MRLAGQHDRFLMEAMWTACPRTVHMPAGGLQAGEFGTPRHLHAELGSGSRRLRRTGCSTRPRRVRTARHGDLPLAFAHLMLGEAAELHAVGDLSTGGIDLTSRSPAATRAGCWRR